MAGTKSPYNPLKLEKASFLRKYVVGFDKIRIKKGKR